MPRHRFREISGWTFLVMVLFSPFSSGTPGMQAEKAPPSPASKVSIEPPLRLQELLQELIQSNPELQAARKRYEAALTRPAQESALPDPRISASWISNGPPYPGAGLGVEPTSNVGIQVAQEFPFPGKRALKGGMAQKQADSQAQSIRGLELDLIAQLKEDFYDLCFTYESLDFILEKQALLRQLEGIQQDIIRASTEILIIENRTVALEQKKLTLNAQILALVNRPPDADLSRPEPISDLPALESFDSMQSRALETSPLLGAQRALIDNQQLNVQSAQKAYYPDFDVMGGYYNQGVLKPMWEFKVQVNIPLYFWKKQRSGLEEAVATLAGTQREYRSREQTLNASLRARYLAAQAARKLMDLYSGQIVPSTQLALESSLASYQTGKLDFLSVLANFNTILDYQLAYYEQRAEYLKAVSRIEELMGNAASGSGSTQGSSGEVRR
jgi:outer membrane protein TolC